MYNRIKNITIWASIVLYVVIALGFIADEKSFVRCKNVDIVIKDSNTNQFVESGDVMAIFKKNNLKVLGYPFDSINTNRMEEILVKSPSIKVAEVYKTIDGVVNVNIEQRKPLVRIINYNNESYYIDQEGALMPLSDKYTAKVLVVNGKLNEPYSLRYTESVSLQKSEAIQRKNILHDIYMLAHYIKNDPFWDAQIQQVYVNDENEFELIPKVGNHIIIFGDIDNYKEKFENLLLVYQKGFRNKGWNRYSIINLKFKNQVVCTKKISANE